MALPSCNPWVSNTVRDSDQLAACREATPRAGQFELEDLTFLALVLDALQRLAVAGVEGFTNITQSNQCDVDENAHNAYCAVNAVSLPIQFNSAEIKALIEWQLGNALCNNNA